jgi:hypothetical protein
MEVQLHAFLNLDTRWRWMVSNITCHFTPTTNWIGGWLGPKASLNAMIKKNNIFPDTAKKQTLYV